MIPRNQKIYHIVHKDRLSSIIQDGYLLSDRLIRQKQYQLPTIGLDNIKNRRLNELKLDSYPDLFVGDCVPFYFCPRSVMLYLIYQKNSALTYQDGQENIIHLQADLSQVIEWAKSQNIRFAFTTSNAGSYYFNDYCKIDDLDKINWDAVVSTQWSNPEIKEGKQAEFLIEKQFPFELFESIGIYSDKISQEVKQILSNRINMNVNVCRNWYY